MTIAPSLRLALAAACALAVGVAGSALAQGETVEIQTQVKLRNSAPAFHGRVAADNANCVEDRKVKMFKQKRSGAHKLLGIDHADNDGKWSIPFDKVTSGAYYAVAPKVEQGTAGTIYECVRDTSKISAVDGPPTATPRSAPAGEPRQRGPGRFGDQRPGAKQAGLGTPQARAVLRGHVAPGVPEDSPDP
jgi:hypothetical protein